MKYFTEVLNVLALCGCEMLERGYAHTSCLKYRISVISHPWTWQLSRKLHYIGNPQSPGIYGPIFSRVSAYAISYKSLEGSKFFADACFLCLKAPVRRNAIKW